MTPKPEPKPAKTSHRGSKPPPDLTAEQLRAFSTNGFTMRETGAQFGVSESAIHDWCQALGVVWQQQRRGRKARHGPAKATTRPPASQPQAKARRTIHQLIATYYNDGLPRANYRGIYAARLAPLED